MRLDKYLVKEGYFETGNKAKDEILSGRVLVNGGTILKAGYKLKSTPTIKIEGESLVSRAGWKLKNYLDKYEIKVDNLTALDIGSSTGGFSEVLLKKGVKRVVAVDVGREQLHHSIRNDVRVELYEETDVREFDYSEKFDLVVSYVSFISLHHIVEKIDVLSKGAIMLLFKPQFEVGKDAKRDKRGVVVDKNRIEESLNNFLDRVVTQFSWKLIRVEKSSILGREGNEEYILHFFKEEGEE